MGFFFIFTNVSFCFWAWLWSKFINKKVIALFFIFLAHCGSSHSPPNISEVDKEKNAHVSKRPRNFSYIFFTCYVIKKSTAKNRNRYTYTDNNNTIWLYAFIFLFYCEN